MLKCSHQRCFVWQNKHPRSTSVSKPTVYLHPNFVLLLMRCLLLSIDERAFARTRELTSIEWVRQTLLQPSEDMFFSSRVGVKPEPSSLAEGHPVVPTAQARLWVDEVKFKRRRYCSGQSARHTFFVTYTKKKWRKRGCDSIYF